MNAKNIIWHLLSFSFILNLAIGMISNYSLSIFLIKLFASVVLFILIAIDSRINKIDIKELIKNHNPKKILLVVGLFTSYLLITLIYSEDPLYGLQKILNFLIITVPLIAAFYFLINTYNEKRIKAFINSLVIITLFSVGYILIDYPFQPGTLYKFQPERWSHVIYGRMIGTIALVLIFYSISLKDFKTSFFYSIISAIAVYGLFLSTHRSSLISLVVVVVVVGGWLVAGSIKKTRLYCVTDGQSGVKSKNYVPQLALFTVIGLALILIFILPKPEIVTTRYGNLSYIEEMEFRGDAPILSRIEALKFSKDMFLDNPVFGVGFGGFKAYNSVTEFLKYPHNIFVEMAVEGGVVGFLILCALIFVMIKSVLRFFDCLTVHRLSLIA
jgi:O-antigen ligase